MTAGVISRYGRMTAMIVFGASVVATPANAQTPLLGEVDLIASNFCPRGWLPADGRLLRISEYTALFAVMGTTYGGNGTTDFALPKVSFPTQSGGPLMACVATQGAMPRR
jgi:microcystin-dependent protein